MDAQSAAKLPFNLKILATDENGIPLPGLPFVAMFNPEGLTIAETIDWKERSVPAKAGDDPAFGSIKARTFSLDITLDGTGVNTNGAKIPVTAQVALFRSVTTI